MNNEQQNDKKEKQSDWAIAAPLFFSGTQFALTCFVGAWLGKFLDEKYETDPVLILIFSFLFASVGFWNFIRTINKANKKYD